MTMGVEPKKLPPGIREHHRRYQVRYWGADGKQHSRSFKRLTDAKRFKSEVDVDKQRGQWLDPSGARVPFDEWAWTHLASRHRLGEAKRSNVESVITCHIVGGSGFGATPLGRITPLDVQDWVNAMVELGYASSYVRGAYTTLSGILRAAAAAKLIREAPITGIELPACERRRERFLNEAEIDKLMECLAPNYRPLVLTAAWTGLRWGELSGLRREYLDLSEAQLQVRTVLTRFGLKDCPKSDSGRRTIGLPGSVVVTLKDYLSDAPTSEYVFTSRSGAMLRESNFRRRHWNPAVEAAGLQPLTFHDLRHSHVALLIRYGWQEYTIVRRLGWKDGTMLYRVYGHLFPNHDAGIVADLDRHLKGARSDEGTVVAMQRRN